jgi:hypothetical protein
MELPPKLLSSDPTAEQLRVAELYHMEYRKVFSSGKFLYWKLYHKKTKRDCGCG